MQENEVIVCAAQKIKYKGEWVVFPSIRHGDKVFWGIVDAFGVEDDLDFDTHEQGFLTNQYRFVDRIEGKEIAARNGQIIQDAHKRELFSESLY